MAVQVWQKNLSNRSFNEFKSLQNCSKVGLHKLCENQHLYSVLVQGLFILKYRKSLSALTSCSISKKCKFMMFKIGAISLVSSFSIIDLMLSGPAALLCVFIFFCCFSTPFMIWIFLGAQFGIFDILIVISDDYICSLTFSMFVTFLVFDIGLYSFCWFTNVLIFFWSYYSLIYFQ